LANLNGRVAIIDDDHGMRTSIERLLSLNGFKVEVFESPERFLSQTHRDEYSCVVLDVHFDGMSGLDLQKTLLVEKRNIPIIFISAEDADQIPDLPPEHAFLHKPFSGSLLVKMIHRAIASSASNS
jgi:FixJ family two-component response regulator